MPIVNHEGHEALEIFVIVVSFVVWFYGPMRARVCSGRIPRRFSRYTPRCSSTLKPLVRTPTTVAERLANGVSVPNTICEAGTSSFSDWSCTGFADPAVS